MVENDIFGIVKSALEKQQTVTWTLGDTEYTGAPSGINDSTVSPTLSKRLDTEGREFVTVPYTTNKGDGEHIFAQGDPSLGHVENLRVVD